ncbi:hypothetical protein MKX01_020095 [Papaver californicum]|nr:hypothetical protein MKX01_020095 [Papaver californicum]
MDRDKVDLNSFGVRLGLNEEVVLHLAWMQDPCFPFSLVHNEHFLKFWDEAVPDDKEFISLTLFGDGSLNIDETPKKINKTKPKKPVSLEKPVRRSPRFQVEKLVKNSHQQRGPSRKLSFTDLLNETEGNSCVSEASKVGCSSEPRQENFDHDYWVHTATQYSTVEDGVKDTDNEDNVHLLNTKLDECHPIEDPNVPNIFDSDEYNDICYEEHVKTYKVPSQSEDSSSSEDNREDEADDPEVEVIDKDGGPEVEAVDKDDGPEVKSGYKVGGKPDWYKIFQPDIRKHIEEEDELPLFPEEEEIPAVEPGKMMVKYSFNDKKYFKRHFKRYCVFHNYQFKLKKSCSKQVRALCRFRDDYECKWFVYASRVKGEPTFVVRSVNLTHTCVGDRKSFNRSADPEYVKNTVLEKLKISSGSLIPKPRQIANDFSVSHNINIPYICAWKARNLVFEELFGNYEDSYNQIPRFCAMVAKTNEGSIAKFTYGRKGKCHNHQLLQFYLYTC